MRTIACPSDVRNAAMIYEKLANATNSPRKERLNAIRARIVCSYGRYDRHTERLDRVRRLGWRIAGTEADDLRACYENFRSSSSEYVRILGGSYWCSYCRLTESSTLDHYFPKADWPEFAVLPANLVPACGICNRPRQFRKNGKRLILHPYFDKIPKFGALVADVSVKGDVPDVTFRLSHNPLEDATTFDFYSRHVKTLNLLSRYRSRALAGGALGSIAKSIHKWGNSRDTATISHILSDSAHDEASVWGENDFQVVLYRGAAAAVEFIDYCLAIGAQ